MSFTSGYCLQDYAMGKKLELSLSKMCSAGCAGKLLRVFLLSLLDVSVCLDKVPLTT